MYNWNIDTTQIKNNTAEYDKFVLEQQINFGLNGTKISLRKLKQFWSDLHLDPTKKAYLEQIVWPQS